MLYHVTDDYTFLLSVDNCISSLAQCQWFYAITVQYFLCLGWKNIFGGKPQFSTNNVRLVLEQTVSCTGIGCHISLNGTLYVPMAYVARFDTRNAQ